MWMRNAKYCSRNHLPAIVQFDEAKEAPNEFAYGIGGRFLEWHELILRPILYCTLHIPETELPSPEFVSLAQRHIDLCATLLTKGHSTLRHGGSWYTLHRQYSYACLMLAVVMSDNKGIRAPENWLFCVESAIQALRLWGKEASNLEEMAASLEDMLSQVLQHVMEDTEMDS